MHTSQRSNKSALKSLSSDPMPGFSKQQQQQLARLILDTYGAPAALAHTLDLGVEMLFYLEEDSFDKREVQKVVSALRAMIQVLREPA